MFVSVPYARSSCMFSPMPNVAGLGRRNVRDKRCDPVLSPCRRPPQALAPLQQQLSTALAGLAEAQQSCAELWRGLPEAHPASAAILAAMEDAPSLWGFSSTSADDAAAAESSGGGAAAAWDSLGNDGSGGGANAGKKGAGAEGGGGGVGQRRRRKRLADVKNPFLRACIAEDGCHAGGLFPCAAAIAQLVAACP